MSKAAWFILILGIPSRHVAGKAPEGSGEVTTALVTQYDEASRALGPAARLAILGIHQDRSDSEGRNSPKPALTPGLLRGFPGLEARLLAGGGRAWAEVFDEALSGRSRVPLAKDDLAALALRAVLGAETDEELGEVLRAVIHWDLRTALPAVVGLLKSPDSSIRAYAVYALRELRARESIPRLTTLASSAGSEERRAALWALSELRAREAVPAVAELLEDPDPEMRMAASWTLAELGAREARTLIGRLLQDRDGDVRGMAAAALGMLGIKDLALEIEELLFDSSPAARRGAVEALAHLGKRSALPRIAGLLGDRDPGVRAQAALALAALGAAARRPEIAKMLRDRDVDVRVAAAEALGDLEPTGFEEDLAHLLDDKHPVARSAACGALGTFPSKRTLPLLVERLSDPESLVRVAAACVLAGIGDRRAVPTLLAESQALHYLNVVADPAAWARWTKRARWREVEGPRKEILESLARTAGVTLDLSLLASAAGERWLSVPCRVRSSPGPRSLVGMLREVLTGHYYFILEGTCVRVLPHEDALASWKTWWIEEQRRIR